VESTFIVSLAGLHAMSGRFDEARELFACGRAIVDELGLKVWLAGFSLVASDIEMLAGGPGTAEAHLRAGYEALQGMGDRGLLSTVAAALARAIYAQGRYEEAERFTEISEELDGRGTSPRRSGGERPAQRFSPGGTTLNGRRASPARRPRSQRGRTTSRSGGGRCSISRRSSSSPIGTKRRHSSRKRRVAGEHEEVLLVALPVVHTHRFVLGEHIQVHADLRELGVVPEWADSAATFRISPASLARVDDEPAGSGLNEPRVRRFERRLRNHGGDSRPACIKGR
jgi:hypothetical protein